VRFHGVRHQLITTQADSLGLEPLLSHTHPSDFEPVFLQQLKDLKQRGCEGVVFGNIHSRMCGSGTRCGCTLPGSSTSSRSGGAAH